MDCKGKKFSSSFLRGNAGRVSLTYFNKNFMGRLICIRRRCGGRAGGSIECSIRLSFVQSINRLLGTYYTCLIYQSIVLYIYHMLYNTCICSVGMPLFRNSERGFSNMILFRFRLAIPHCMVYLDSQ